MGLGAEAQYAAGHQGLEFGQPFGRGGQDALVFLDQDAFLA